MEILTTIFNELLYRPLFNVLVFFYNVIPGHDFGVAIIILTLIIRLILYPLSQKAIKSQKVLSELQPKIKEIQKKYKNKEEQAKEMMKFYQEYKINPFSGCLPLLIQLPILIALYRTFISGFDPSKLTALYGFIKSPGAINPMFLGALDLSQRSPILAILAGFFQFIQSKMMTKTQKIVKTDKGLNIQNIMGQQMTYFMPIITVFIAWSFPAGLPLYWIVTTLFSIGQQWWVLKDQKSNIKNQTSKI